MRHLRRSLPRAQDRTVLCGSGGGLPYPSTGALHPVPTGALPVWPCSGSAVQRDGKAVVGPCNGATAVGGDAVRTGQPPWEATLFAAAQDAKKGDLWPAEVRWFDENDDAGRRGTQGRHLEVAGRLTGVHRQLEQRQRERIAVRLGVATLTLIAGARRWGRSLQSRGEAILEVLAAIPIGASLLDRLLAAGALSGLWNSSQPRSAPQRWDALRGSWVIAPGAESARSASEPVERRAAVAAQQRAPPHTSSLHPGAEPRSTVGA